MRQKFKKVYTSSVPLQSYYDSETINNNGGNQWSLKVRDHKWVNTDSDRPAHQAFSSTA